MKIKGLLMAGSLVWSLIAPGGAVAAGYFVDVGDILTANYFGNKVVRVDPRSGAQQIFGNFTAPTDLALAPTGDLYVGELGGAIKRLTITNGAITRVNPASSLTSVRGLTLGSGGDLYVTGRSNTVDVVMRVNPLTGVETEITRGGDLSLPAGIEILDASHLVVASFLNSRIVKVRISDGAQTVIASGGVWIDQPWGLAVSGDLIYASHYDSKHINRISASTGETSLLAIAPGFPYGLGLDADGNVLVGAVGNVGQQDMLARFDPQGTPVATFNVGLNQQISGIEVVRFPIGTPTNRSPVISPIADKIVDEGASLSFAVTASDPDVPPQTLTFSLAPGAPPGASISPAGVFTWIPGATAGPGTYPITVVVTDDGIPPLSDTNAFSVTVNDVTNAPAIKGGDILAANNDSDTVIKVDPQTGATQVLGSFAWPTDVALASNRFLYVSEWWGTIQRLDLQTGKTAIVNSNSALSDLWGLALGAGGELYVTSEATDSVVRIDPDTGAEQVISEGNLLSGVRGLALLDSGHLVVASMFNNSLVSVALADGAQTLIAANNGIDQPWGVTVAGTNIYVASSGSQSIQRAWVGHVETVASITNGSPMGIAVEDDGHILAGVTGAQTNALMRIDAQGAALDSWGGAQIGQLTGLKVVSFPEPPQYVALSVLGNGSYRLLGNGIPGRTYRFEYTESLSPPNWQTVGTSTANALGVFELIDWPPAGTQARYYRSSYP